MGAAVERTPKIEQVNLTGGRLIREAKVCYSFFLRIKLRSVLFPAKIEMVSCLLFLCKNVRNVSMNECFFLRIKDNLQEKII